MSGGTFKAVPRLSVVMPATATPARRERAEQTNCKFSLPTAAFINSAAAVEVLLWVPRVRMPVAVGGVLKVQ